MDHQNAQSIETYGDGRASAIRRSSPSKNSRSSSNASALPQLPAKGRNGEKSATKSSASAKGSTHALGRSSSVRLPCEALNEGVDGGDTMSRAVSSRGSSIQGGVKQTSQRHNLRQSLRMPPPSSFPGSRSSSQSQSLTGSSALPSHPRLSDAASTTSSRSTSNGSQNATSATASSRRRGSTRSSLSAGASARPLLSESRPRRSFSTVTHDTGNPASRTSTKRDSFTAYQHEYAPHHSSRIRTSLVASAGSRSSSTARATTHRKQQHSQTNQTQQSQTPSTATLRQQTHLLHLSLLHASSMQTLKVYNASARASLQQRFADLQALYTSLLTLRRTVRQNRNLLALQHWSGGNTQTLVRKLNVLTNALVELCDLTRPDPHANDPSTHDIGMHGSAYPSEPENEQEEGHYSLIVSAFSTWVAWVSEVWGERDVVRFTSTEAPLEMQEPPTSAMLPIEGLGDGMKIEIKGLLQRVDGIAVRLEGLGIKSVTGGRGSSGSPLKGLGLDMEWERSTPAVLVGLARDLVKEMQEELQVMREIEFEVVVGEKAWLEEQIRRVGEQVDGS